LLFFQGDSARVEQHARPSRVSLACSIVTRVV
jgi:hypothetical protein